MENIGLLGIFKMQKIFHIVIIWYICKRIGNNVNKDRLWLK